MSLSLLLWNADTTNHKATAGLRALLKEHRPHAAVISEAYHIGATVAGYTVHRPSPGTARAMTHGAVDEARDVLLAIRNDVRIVRRTALPMTVAWDGPNGRPHSAKVYQSATLGLPGKGGTWRLLGSHWPTGHAGKNRVPCNETMTQAGIWLKSGLPGRPSIVAGDLNVNASDLTVPLHQWGATTDGHNVDRAICRGARVSGVLVLDSHGSDHQAVLLHIMKGHTR